MADRSYGRKFYQQIQLATKVTRLESLRLFLWGYLKARVYLLMPKTIEDFKANITKEIKNIDKNILKSTFLNFQKRWNLIIKLNGGHVENK